MNKKLLAIAVAAALAPVAAMADSGNVVIYGQVNVSYDLVDPGLNGGGGQRVSQVNDNQSRLGFKGTEDVGNGVSAVWQIESAIAADGTAPSGSGAAGTPSTAQNTGGSIAAGTTLGQRNTFVGLSSKTAGTAILGRHDTPYKISTRGLDMFADGIADNRNLMGQGVPGVTTFDGRQSNVVAYISPTVSGVTGAIGYVAGAENAYLSNATKKGDAWSAMVNYGNGPVYASLAYERHNVGFGTVGTGTSGTLGVANAIADKSEHAWKLGLGYTMDAFKVNFAYEKTGDDFAANLCSAGTDDCGHNTYYLAGGYTMGNNVLKLAYTKQGDLGSSTNTGAKQWALGVDHNMSKRTSLFALYTKLNNDTNRANGLLGASNGGVTGLNAGSSPSAWSFGMRHSF